MKELDLNFNDACFVGDSLYFSARDFNGLFRIKKGTEYAEWLGQFPGEHPCQKYLHYKVAAYEGAIYFTPFSGHGIHMYDLNEKKINFYLINDEKVVSFSNAIEINGKIYMIPLNRDTPFVIYDAEDKSIYIENDFWKYISKYSSINDKSFIGGSGAVQVNKTLYMIVYGRDMIISYDVETHDLCVKKLRFSPISIQYLEDYFYFSVLGSSKIIKYKIEKNQTKEIISGFGMEVKASFSSIRWYQNKMLLMPGGYRTDVIEALAEGKNIKFDKIPLCDPDRRVSYKGLYKNFLQRDKWILFLPKIGNGITVLDLSNRTTGNYKVKCDPIHSERCCALQKYDGMEQESSDLKMFINLLLGDFYRIVRDQNKNIGKEIWENIKREDSIHGIR